jgi:hypothetical protein
MRQKRRENNLRKWKEEEGSEGKGSGRRGKSVKGKRAKVKSRPGFEGSFASGWRRR